MQTRWARNRDPNSAGLETMLSMAVSQYQKQTDWFLQHRAAGIQHLAAVLTAVVAVKTLGSAGGPLAPFVAVAILVLLAPLAIFLTVSAIRSCRRAYIASIEYGVMTTKVVWAMGLTTSVVVDSVRQQAESPVPDDPSFFVPRHIENHIGTGGVEARRPLRTADVVAKTLRQRGNTYFWARLTLLFFGLAVALLAVVCAAVVASDAGRQALLPQ